MSPVKMPSPSETESLLRNPRVGAGTLIGAVIVAGQWWLSGTLGLKPQWLFPVAAGILLAASLATEIIPGRNRAFDRALGIGTIGVLVLANLADVVLLVSSVFGLGARIGPPMLLGSGAVVWLLNVLVFGIVYWELDGDGPELRIRDRENNLGVDFLFPQQQDPDHAYADWTPRLGDYMYVALTNGTAFSPTDTMPLTLKAKFAMGLQSLMSLVIVGVLIARAVNIAV